MAQLTLNQIHRKPSTELNDRIVEICIKTNNLVGTDKTSEIKTLREECSQIINELHHRTKQILEAACY